MKIKIIFFLLLFLLVNFFTNAQQIKKSNLEDNMLGFQLGILGAWVYYETKLSNKFALRTELGLDGGYSYSDFDNPKSQYFFLPSITAEPRWYYNLEKRVKQGKAVANNGSNFFSLRTSYNPNLFEITNVQNSSDISIFRIIPSWGFRRYLGGNFNMELRLGLGYVTSKSLENQNDGFIPDISFRFGYTF